MKTRAQFIFKEDCIPLAICLLSISGLVYVFFVMLRGFQTHYPLGLIFLMGMGYCSFRFWWEMAKPRYCKNCGMLLQRFPFRMGEQYLHCKICQIWIKTGVQRKGRIFDSQGMGSTLGGKLVEKIEKKGSKGKERDKVGNEIKRN